MFSLKTEWNSLLVSAPGAHADDDEAMEDLEELPDEIKDSELCEVMDSLLLDIPINDYPIVADFLPPRWIIGLWWLEYFFPFVVDG